MVNFLIAAAIVAYGLILLYWLLGLIGLHRLGRDARLRLAPAPDLAAAGDEPSLAIYIAAHNEQHRIEDCLNRLLSQNYPNMRIVVVNDRSRDATAACVAAVMTRDPRVRLIDIETLPAGWIGKTHALAVAAERADADYLMFIDSDCRLAAGAVAAVMRKVVAEKLEFATLWPSLVLRSPSERLMTPVAGWLLGLWAMLGTTRRRSRTEVEMGNGQFMVFALDAYRRIGGHAAVQAELAEDAILARKAAEAGLRRWVGLGIGLYSTTRDNTFNGTFNALTRVLIGSLCAPWKILVSTQLLLGGCVLPVWVFPLCAWLYLDLDSAAAGALAAMSAAHYVVMSLAVGRLFDLMLVRRGTVLSFPIGALCCVIVLIWSYLVMTGRGTVRWGPSRYTVRGSQIQVGSDVAAGPSSIVSGAA